MKGQKPLKVIYVILFLYITACNINNVEKQSTMKNNDSTYEESQDYCYITLHTHFKNDFVTIILNKDTLLSDSITTDYSNSIATTIQIKQTKLKEDTVLKVVIDNNYFYLPYPNHIYNYYFITKDENNISLSFTDEKLLLD